MRTRRAKGVALLVTISLSFVVGLPVSRVRARAPVSKKAVGVPAQSPPNWEVESAALRQQLEEQRQLMDTLRGQFEEKQGAVKALEVRLDARGAVEDALLGQLEDQRQEDQRQRRLLYGAVGAIIVLGLLLNLQGGSPHYRTQNRRRLGIRHNWTALQKMSLRPCHKRGIEE